MSASLQPSLEQVPDRTVGVIGRVGRLAFALAFQLATFIVIYIVIHILSGHYGNSVYSKGQQIVAGVLGFPAAALGAAALVAAVYTAATGRRGRMTFGCALAAVGVFAVMYAFELALR